MKCPLCSRNLELDHMDMIPAENPNYRSVIMRYICRPCKSMISVDITQCESLFKTYLKNMGGNNEK